MNSDVWKPGRVVTSDYFPAFARIVGTTYTPRMTPAMSHSHLLFMLCDPPFYLRPAVTAKRNPAWSRT